MKWFVGLGNPGREYEATRHNVGFMAMDRFAARHGISVTQSKCKALIGDGQVNGQKVVLLKPMTYMNLSGEAVRAYMDFYKVKVEDAIVVYDDLDTELGAIRLRYQGSAGGHNGIKSIIQHTGTQTFNRIRIGVSRPPQGYNIADYVLSTFRKADVALLDEVLDKTVQAMEESINQSFEKCMALFNR